MNTPVLPSLPSSHRSSGSVDGARLRESNSSYSSEAQGTGSDSDFSMLLKQSKSKPSEPLTKPSQGIQAQEASRRSSEPRSGQTQKSQAHNALKENSQASSNKASNSTADRDSESRLTNTREDQSSDAFKVPSSSGPDQTVKDSGTLNTSESSTTDPAYNPNSSQQQAFISALSYLQQQAANLSSSAGAGMNGSDSSSTVLPTATGTAALLDETQNSLRLFMKGEQGPLTLNPQHTAQAFSDLFSSSFYQKQWLEKSANLTETATAPMASATSLSRDSLSQLSKNGLGIAGTSDATLNLSLTSSALGSLDSSRGQETPSDLSSLIGINPTASQASLKEALSLQDSALDRLQNPSDTYTFPAALASSFSSQSTHQAASTHTSLMSGAGSFSAYSAQVLTRMTQTGEHQAIVKVSPDQLGNITIGISTPSDGSKGMMVTFSASSAQTQSLLEAHVNAIKETLSSLGWNSPDVKVVQASSSQSADSSPMNSSGFSNPQGQHHDSSAPTRNPAASEFDSLLGPDWVDKTAEFHEQHARAPKGLLDDFA